MCVCVCARACVWVGGCARACARLIINALDLHYLIFMFVYFARDRNSNFQGLQRTKNKNLECSLADGDTHF